MKKSALLVLVGLLAGGSLLLSGLAYAQEAQAAPAKPAPTKIFAGAKIFIEDQGEFAMALGASFIEKKVPVTVVNLREKADFILKAASQDRKASTAGKIFGVSRDRYHGTVSIFNQEGILVFAYNVKKGTFQDAANSTANEIKHKQIGIG
jgi:hypothetical protein